MAEKFLLEMAETIKASIPGNNIQIEDQGNKAVISGDMECGIKGINVSIECSTSTIKIKGAREYKYPITEASKDIFQQEMIKKYNGDYNIYASGQMLAFSKFFSYQTSNEAINITKNAIAAMQDMVEEFENKCVNFMEKTEDDSSENEEYNPEANVNIVNVDNNYHAVSMTEQDNQAYDDEHKSFSEEIFDKLVTSIGGRRVGNEVTVSDEESGKITRCVLFPLDAEILVSVSTNVSHDIGAMYASFINANYPELRSAYDTDNELFTVRRYSSPDKYAPEETEEYLKMCSTAIDACVQNYKATLTKKDSSDFASDVQQILAEQTETVAEREKVVASREEAMAQKEQEMLAREAELNKKLKEVEAEKAKMQAEAEKEQKRLEEHEKEMQDKIKEYEDRNTRDILNIQQLANQVAALQNRQNALGNVDKDAEEEIFRMKSKVQQLTSQKIALESKLTEKINLKEKRIRELSDTISEKNAEISKINLNIDDMVQSKVTTELGKTEKKMKSMESQLKEIGHILTPEDLIEYLEQYDDMEIKKFHAPNAEVVAYNDGALEIRIRIGDMNYVDVSREASLKDQVLRVLNSKHGDVKFFSKDNKIIARAYFKKNASTADVDDLIATLASNFNK